MAASPLARLQSLFRSGHAGKRIRRKFAGNLFFRLLGPVVNRPGNTLALAFTPDQIHEYGGLPDYPALYRVWGDKAQWTNGGDPFRLVFLMQNIELLLREGVPGDFVELGVYKGNSAKVLAHYARRDDRRLFLLDTFEGFSSDDLVGVDASHSAAAFSDTSLERVKAFVGTDRTEYIKGRFPESVGDRTFRIAVLNIDCDLYEPALACLERFYPQMSPGGLIFIHDYSSGHWPGIALAVDAFFASRPEKPVLMPDKSGTAIVRVISLPT